ncbi:MAG: insulinase family protein [Candidatus Riflebacteria bacterium]|nr:insulinase family protein [Candidatus Riflebacteria bacterium]
MTARSFRTLFLAVAAVLVVAVAGHAQSLAEFEKKVTTFTLDNGMKFLVVERHEAPVVSFITFANVGSSNETKGITGVAHLFEHMAFKGTTTIGTKDLAAETAAVAKEDEAFQKLRAELVKGDRADPKALEAARKELEEAKAAARAFVVNGEFAEALEKAGATGVNAFTSYDFTGYISSLPSNKLELWFSLESDRFLNPFLRDFYAEKDVVMEERRMGNENTPRGKLFEEFGSIAFLAHPYGEPLIGHMSDLQALPRAKAEAFFREQYAASNLTAVIVGDVDPKHCRDLAQTYFGRLPKRPRPEPVVTREPPQKGERRVVLELPSQPYLVMGFHKPDFNHPSKIRFDVLADILSGGRSSRLHQSLVKDKKVAIRAFATPNYPGSRYPNLFLFMAIPAQGHTPEECEAAIDEEIGKLRTAPVTQEELDKAKVRARAMVVGGLDSNENIAQNLAYYEVVAGDWREMFRRGLETINEVTAAEIQELAQTWLVKENRSVGLIRTVQKPEPPKAK